MAKHEFGIPQSERLVPRDLGAERTRQIDIYVRLGLHYEHGVSEEWYRAHMPQIHEQPKEYQGRFDLPLIVDPLVMGKLESLGLENKFPDDTAFLDSLVMGQWDSELGNRFAVNLDTIFNEEQDMYLRPYALWTHDAKMYMGNSVKEAQLHFRDDERNSRLVDVVALYVQHPRVFRGTVRNVYAPGSHDGIDFNTVYGLGITAESEAKLIRTGRNWVPWHTDVRAGERGKDMRDSILSHGEQIVFAV